MVNLQSLLDEFRPTECECILNEVNGYLAFREYEKKQREKKEPVANSPPVQTFIPKHVVPKFENHIKLAFQSIAASPAPSASHVPRQ
jgi:hypothetical protein